MNIHRPPLNGRNFQYCSEAPLVSGLTAAVTTEGVRSNTIRQAGGDGDSYVRGVGGHTRRRTAQGGVSAAVRQHPHTKEPHVPPRAPAPDRLP